MHRDFADFDHTPQVDQGLVVISFFPSSSAS